MNFNKKIATALSLFLVTLLVVFYACKKENAVTSTGESGIEFSDNSHDGAAARSLDTLVFYSLDDSLGYHYKVKLYWNTSGVVYINRSIVTNYPPQTVCGLSFEDDVDMTVCGLGSYADTTIADSVYIPIDNINKKYYVISAQPSNAGVFPLGPQINGRHVIYITVECDCSGSGKCTVQANGYRTYYCRDNGCSKKCQGTGTVYFDDGTHNTTPFMPVINRTGGVVVEASNYVVIH